MVVVECLYVCLTPMTAYGVRIPVETKKILESDLESTLIVGIFNPCQPMPYRYYVFLYICLKKKYRFYVVKCF